MSGEQRVAWHQLPRGLGAHVDSEGIWVPCPSRGVSESSRCLLESVLWEAAYFPEQLLLLTRETAHQQIILLLLLYNGPMAHQLEVRFVVLQ